MKNFFRKTLFVIALFISSSSIYAQDPMEVTPWVKKILLATLSVDYHYKQGSDDPIHVNYTANAWDALSQFLGGYIPIIKEQHLTIHPVFSQEPFVTTVGVFTGIPYWRINAVVFIPELNLTIAFSLIVIATTNGGFLIQSIDMVKKENS